MATARPLPLIALRGDDFDPEETQEWLESIDSVLRVHGAERAHFLLECMIDHARRSGAYLPYSPNTAYLNTIPVGQQPEYPGDRAIERRIEALYPLERDGDGRSREPHQLGVRRPHRELRLVGHACTKWASIISGAHRRRSTAATSCTSRATRRPASTRARSSKGRLDENNLNHFRQEVAGHRRRALVVSASVADAGILAVPDGVDGPGPDDGDLPGALHALPRAPRHRAAAGSQGVVLLRRRRDRRARVDGRDHDAGARAARQSDLRHQLQSAAPRRPRARQRQDHSRARSRVSGRRLERHQGRLGLALGSAARARRARVCCARRWKSASTASTRRSRRRAARTRASTSSAAIPSSRRWSRTSPTRTSGI